MYSTINYLPPGIWSSNTGIDAEVPRIFPVATLQLQLQISQKYIIPNSNIRLPNSYGATLQKGYGFITDKRKFETLPGHMVDVLESSREKLVVPSNTSI